MFCRVTVAIANIGRLVGRVERYRTIERDHWRRRGGRRDSRESSNFGSRSSSESWSSRRKRRWTSSTSLSDYRKRSFSGDRFVRKIEAVK